MVRKTGGAKKTVFQLRVSPLEFRQCIFFCHNNEFWDNTDIEFDSGIVSFRNLVAQSIDQFIRADSFDLLTETPVEQLQTISNNAIRAISERQKSTGLLTTWTQDGSSWLYGQGLAPESACEEGQWNDGAPSDDLARNGNPIGTHFPGNTPGITGILAACLEFCIRKCLVKLEGDNTVWMGDFPWIPGSLACYFRKSGDESELPAIIRAKTFFV